MAWVKVLIQLLKSCLAMWRMGFFFHEMGFGLLSVFLPLYVISQTVRGSLFDIGLMSAAALFLAIPFSFFWGYVSDKTRRYKRYILLSFLSSTVLLYFFSLTTSVSLLIVLYVVLSIFHVAHEPSKNVLIAEHYSHEDWEKSFAFYEGLTEVGWLIGLLLGFFMSVYGVAASYTLLVCSVLNLVAFVLSLILVTDPLLIFERSLVSMEKTVDFASRGIFLASRLLDGTPVSEGLKRENVNAFCCGLVLFSLATSILFTPMPVFVSRIVDSAALPASLVFAIFILNSGGSVAGYFFARARSEQPGAAAYLGRTVLFRGLLTFLLIAIAQVSLYAAGLATPVLMLMGFAYALFQVYTLSLSMELIPAGKAGLFNVLIGVGGACGSFIGPFVAETFSFTWVFVTAGVIFLLAYVAFKLFT
jgi:MFS family permease